MNTERYSLKSLIKDADNNDSWKLVIEFGPFLIETKPNPQETLSSELSLAHATSQILGYFWVQTITIFDSHFVCKAFSCNMHVENE